MRKKLHLSSLPRFMVNTKHLDIAQELLNQRGQQLRFTGFLVGKLGLGLLHVANVELTRQRHWTTVEFERREKAES